MKKKLVLLFIIMLTLMLIVGCGKESDSVETNKLDITKMTAEEIINEFKEAEYPINSVIVYTEETDVNKLLGRPNQYTSKINFSDGRLEQYDEANNPIGGSIEVFDNEDDAKNRKEYIDSIGESSSILSEYSYIYKNVLLRLNKSLTPTQAKEYEEGFIQLQSGEKINN